MTKNVVQHKLLFLIFLPAVLWAVLFQSCKKESLKFSDTPEIAFVSITPEQAKANSDSVVITISYKDGNGDLGENNNEVKNLFVTDSRNNVTYQFRVKQLAPNDAVIAIQGELDIVLNTVPLINGNTAEQVNYNVYIVDRAGNQSNTVTTSTISVTP